MAGSFASDSFAEALEALAVVEKIAEDPEGAEALDAYICALETHDYDDAAAIRYMLDNDAEREHLVLLGECWLEIEAELRGGPEVRRGSAKSSAPKPVPELEELESEEPEHKLGSVSGPEPEPAPPPSQGLLPYRPSPSRWRT